MAAESGVDREREEDPAVPRHRMPPLIAALKDFAASRLKRVPPIPAPLRVLVVDDEAPVRVFVNRALSGAGYETVLAADGVDALQAAANGAFDILVTDLMMPEMNGSELARRLRQLEPNLKVLYLTGFSDHLFKEKAALWEDEAFLDKPCSITGLLEAVSLLATGRVPPDGAKS